MYTTTTNIENKLGTTLTAEQAAYFTDILSPAIDQYIDNQTNTSFVNGAATVYVDGEGTSLLLIPTMNTVTAVKNEAGDTIPADDYTLLPQSTIEKTAIRSKAGVWSEGYENYSIIGKLGHSEVPETITHIATELAVNAITNNTSGLKSEKVGDWSATYADVEKSISPLSLNLLKSYDRLSRRI